MTRTIKYKHADRNLTLTSIRFLFFYILNFKYKGGYIWLGENVTILSGVTISNHVVVAAGAVVTKDVADNFLIVGVLAKLLKTIPNDV